MAVKLLTTLSRVLQYFCLQGSTDLPTFLFDPFSYTYVIYPLVYKSSPHLLLEWIHHWTMAYRACWHTVKLCKPTPACGISGENQPWAALLILELNLETRLWKWLLWATTRNLSLRCYLTEAHGTVKRNTFITLRSVTTSPAKKKTPQCFCNSWFDALEP